MIWPFHSGAEADAASRRARTASVNEANLQSTPHMTTKPNHTEEFVLKPDDFKRALQAIDALGATPAVLLKVAEAAKDPNVELRTMEALLRNDGPLAADIIRISNSPYYAPATFHSNLISAVNFIGLREVIRVVNLSLARQTLRPQSVQLWRLGRRILE